MRKTLLTEEVLQVIHKSNIYGLVVGRKLVLQKKAMNITLVVCNKPSREKKRCVDGPKKQQNTILTNTQRLWRGNINTALHDNKHETHDEI